MRREEQYLFDILDAADSIARFVKDKDELTFTADEILRSAVTMKLFIVGEAVSKLTEETKSRYPEVPWHAIKGFRNFIAHNYFNLRWDIIWNSATSRMPEWRPRWRKFSATNIRTRKRKICKPHRSWPMLLIK